MATVLEVGRRDALRTREVQLATAADLYERHGARVYAYCLRRLRSREEAEDAVQTTFLYACRGLVRGVVPEHEIAWLLKIAQNVCLSHWDETRRRQEVAHQPDMLDRTGSISSSGRDELRAIQKGLASLTDLQRQAILLREWRGLSYREIAERLQLSTAAVETLIFRARKALAERLERQDADAPKRGRLARCLDFSHLFAGAKSVLGGAAATKVAAGGAAITAAVVAGGPVSTSPWDKGEGSALASPASRNAVTAPGSTWDPWKDRPDSVRTNLRLEPAVFGRSDGRPRGEEDRRKNHPSGGTTDQPGGTATGGEAPPGTTPPFSGGSHGDAVESTTGEILTAVSATTDAVIGAVSTTISTVTQTTSSILESATGQGSGTVIGGDQGIVLGGGIKLGGGKILP